MIDFGDLEVAEEAEGEDLKTIVDAQRRAWETEKTERRRSDEQERHERVRRARSRFVTVQHAQAISAVRRAEKEQDAAEPQAGATKDASLVETPAAKEATSVAGREERKNKYKWLLELDKEARKVVEANRLPQIPEEENPNPEGVCCWHLITTGPPPESTDMKKVKKQVGIAGLYVFGAPEVASAKKVPHSGMALAKKGTPAFTTASVCKASKFAEDDESTADISEVSTAEVDSSEAAWDDLDSYSGSSSETEGDAP